jgi:hypothetical protein
LWSAASLSAKPESPLVAGLSSAPKNLRDKKARIVREEIFMHPLNAAIPGERAIVMVREGYGAIGLKDAWTLEELKRGHIPLAIWEILSGRD